MSLNDMEVYIPKEEFDWEYYLLKNPDIKKAGNNTLDKSYRHWITYGCYENRWVRARNGSERQIKLKTGEKMPTFSIQVTSLSKPIELKFKIAIMIHIFDVTMIHCFISYLNDLASAYDVNNFDIYFNVVEENTPFVGDLKQYMEEQLKLITNPHVQCHYSPNQGGDIGGFLILSKIIVTSGIDYRYAIFVHSKNKKSWRINLCHCVFNIKYETLDKMPQMGIISSKKWINTFDPAIQAEEYRKFKYHLIELCAIYGLTSDRAWSFIAGTMFLIDIQIIQYIVSHEVDRVYRMLNRVDSVDVNWLKVLDEKGKDPRGTVNDYQYRLKYGRSLMSDYMIEHTYERIIGLICQHLNLKLIGQ
jgi:hypothetical protein